ncbi:hypothetical protein KZO25_06100 [Halomonas sp. ANAO-440]|uniref:hypothetical protein n=1 Tax=Halomonas sp. ANAO-440 TaxID=2861360 RepID=UPI001CAA6AE4|nr:hypothetical protein [Halomonas sp. ANAO-440]MBZ0329889.1 hypothetical protein [Halomonas sp. ANAO-440]
MWHFLSHKATMSRLKLTAFWLSPTMAGEMDDRPPSDMLLEMVVPTLCMLPPADMADEQVIAMMGSTDFRR